MLQEEFLSMLRPAAELRAVLQTELEMWRQEQLQATWVSVVRAIDYAFREKRTSTTVQESDMLPEVQEALERKGYIVKLVTGRYYYEIRW